MSADRRTRTGSARRRPDSFDGRAVAAARPGPPRKRKHLLRRESLVKFVRPVRVQALPPPPFAAENVGFGRNHDSARRVCANGFAFGDTRSMADREVRRNRRIHGIGSYVCQVALLADNAYRWECGLRGTSITNSLYKPHAVKKILGNMLKRNLEALFNESLSAAIGDGLWIPSTLHVPWCQSLLLKIRIHSLPPGLSCKVVPTLSMSPADESPEPGDATSRRMSEAVKARCAAAAVSCFTLTKTIS